LQRKARKGGGFGAQGAAERPEEATAATMSPIASACGLVAESATAKPERPRNKNKK